MMDDWPPEAIAMLTLHGMRMSARAFCMSLAPLGKNRQNGFRFDCCADQYCDWDSV
jgi:hypothetical protein